MGWVQGLGVLLEIGGLMLAFYGLHTRQSDFGVPGQGAFYPALAAIRRFRKRLRLRIDRLLRQREDTRVEVGLIQGEAQAFNPSGRIGYGPLPDDPSRDASIAELARRTKDLLDRVQDLRDRLVGEAARIDKDVAAVQGEIRADLERLEGQVRQLATGDVALQYVGLSLIGIGLCLQFAASSLR